MLRHRLNVAGKTKWDMGPPEQMAEVFYNLLSQNIREGNTSVTHTATGCQGS